tara:strand:- start:382 stop:690 length:309 start_codon:yes stop_codon:yes gene_type:complete
MASSLNKFSVVESGNVGLGQGGAIFEDGTTVISSKTIIAIQFVDDSAFTTLTPSTSDFIGTAGGNGDAIDSDNVFPAGMVIYGQWTAFTLSSGSVIAYQGGF